MKSYNVEHPLKEVGHRVPGGIGAILTNLTNLTNLKCKILPR